MDIFYYDSATKVRKVVPIEAQTAIFTGSTPTTNGTSGLVRTPTTADVGKFLSANGNWEFTPTYLTQAQAEDLFVSVNDEISAKTAQTATQADKLTTPQTITIQDSHGHSASGTFTGNSTTTITLPDSMFTTVTVAAALTASSASTAAACSGNANTATQLENQVKISITDSSGKLFGDPTWTDFGSEVVLKMPAITATGSGSSAPTGSVGVYITDGENNSTPAPISFDGEDHGIRLPDVIARDITGNADTATRFKTPIKIALKSGNNLGTPKDVIGNEGNTVTTTIELPTVLTGSLKGNADTATKATQDSAGHPISTFFAPIASPTLTGAPKAPTPDADETDTSRIATILYVKRAIANQLGISYEGEGAGTLSLVEMSKAINNDKNFYKTMSDTYLQSTVLLTSMTTLGNVPKDKMFYTDNNNHVAATTITSIGRDILAADTKAKARQAIEAVDVNATVAKAVQLSNPVSFTIQDKRGESGVIATAIFQGNNNVVLKLDKAMSLTLTDTSVSTADRWTNPINMSVSDKSGAHKGTAKPVNGSAAIILPLPDTITAAEFDGLASKAAELNTAVTIKISNSDGSNKTTGTVYHGTESEITLALPETIKAASFNGVATKAAALNTPQIIRILDSTNGDVASGSFTGSSGTDIKLPSNIKVNITGTATSAEKLTTGRKLKVNLSSTTDITFNGSADVTSIPVTGILPISLGGTGQSSLDNITAGKAKALNTARTILGGSFDGTSNLELFGISSTLSATATKTVSISSIKTLSNGLSLSVYFTSNNSASTIKLKINSLTAYDIIGPDGQAMINQRIGLYNFVYYNEKFYTARVPDIEAASATSAEQAAKDGQGRNIVNTYAEKTEAVGDIYQDSSNQYALHFKKISEIGTTVESIASITIPQFAETGQDKITSGTYPILQTTTQNASSNISHGKPKFNPNIKIDNSNGKLIVPVLEAGALILPTTASTLPGAIWIEG